MKTTLDQNWDAIVIGSGIGGMAVASILTRLKKKKVLVLERHWVPGGQTHEFQRKNWSWDVGLHYVGGMEPGSDSRKIMDYITGGEVDWNPLPDDFEHFSFPGEKFSMPKNEPDMIRALGERFPQEKKGIAGFFKAMKKATDWVTLEFTRQLVPAPVAWGIGLALKGKRKIATATTGEILDRHVTDPLLKAILAGTWGDYGLPPGKSAFALHSLVVRSYFGGAWFPEGGSGAIAAAVSKVLATTGGRIEVNAEVTEILVEAGAATGVRVKMGKGSGAFERVFHAPAIYSDAGVGVTYRKLMRPHVPQGWIRDLEQFEPGMSAVTLFVGLKKDPRPLGFHGENNWIYGTLDHDGLDAHGESLKEGRPGFSYLSFPSLKQRAPRSHTAEIISHGRTEDFAKWQGSAWMKRGEDYKALKDRIADGLLDFVEARHPGFKDLVEYRELSTPLTYESFLGRPRGEFYGVPGIPKRYELAWLGIRTPVKGCYLAGSDVMSLGIMGALMGGVGSAALSMGPSGWPTVMGGIRKSSAKIQTKPGA